MEERRTTALLHLQEGKRSILSEERARPHTPIGVPGCKWAVASLTLFTVAEWSKPGSIALKRCTLERFVLQNLDTHIHIHTLTHRHMLAHTLIFGGGNLLGLGRKAGTREGASPDRATETDAYIHSVLMERPYKHRASGQALSTCVILLKCNLMMMRSSDTTKNESEKVRWERNNLCLWSDGISFTVRWADGKIKGMKKIQLIIFLFCWLLSLPSGGFLQARHKKSHIAWYVISFTAMCMCVFTPCRTIWSLQLIWMAIFHISHVPFSFPILCSAAQAAIQHANPSGIFSSILTCIDKPALACL